MKIIISKNAGYCMGVKKAFEGAYKIAIESTEVCIYGEIVHNKFALNNLKEKGLVTINNLDEIIDDKDITGVIIRAHGIPPQEEKKINESNKRIFDFTCPKVKQVQLLAKKLSDDGNTIILFGKKSHPEVVGILGYCKKPYYVIKDIDDAKNLPIDKIKKPAVISQTTMNSIIFNEICIYLRSKVSSIKIYNTLCNSPIRIQDEAIELSGHVDAMIVVGDKMSANTTTLYEKLKEKIDTYFVETIEDIDTKKISKYKVIGITGGSSTPGWQINQIKEFISSNY